MCDKPNRIVIEIEGYRMNVRTIRAEHPDQAIVIVKSLEGGQEYVYGGAGGYAIEPLAVVADGLAVEYEVEG